MDFWSAVKSVFGKYATFQGRACRSEYWYFYLFDIIVLLIAAIIDLAIFGSRRKCSWFNMGTCNFNTDYCCRRTSSSRY